jgi:NAD(P)H-dependent FMN reductase
MKKILAFAGSNSSKSINHQLLEYVASQINNATVNLKTAAELDIPLYSIDTEEKEGIPQTVQSLAEEIKASDGLIISVAEHNGNVTAYFKSIMDWLSRHDRHFLLDKPILLLSASPGGGGAGSARAITEKTLPYFKGEVIASQGIGGFYDLFENGQIKNSEIEATLHINFRKLFDALHN